MKNDNISETLNRVFEQLAQMALEDAQRPRKLTGFQQLDALTTGLADSSLVVIAGCPATGKTLLALDIARHLAKDSATVFFSLELSREAVLARLQKAGGNAYAENENLLIYDDYLVTVREMETICENTKQLGAVIVDCLQLIAGVETPIKWKAFCAEVSSIVCSLKRMAKKLNVPVICLSYLLRECEDRTDRRPALSDLRFSGSLVQDADQILLLYRDDCYNPDTPMGDVVECIVAKNRYGDCGTVRLRWDPEKATFRDEETVQ